jgi:tetratricopeptide (TPR) repeat protein
VGQVDVNHSRGNDEVVSPDFLKPRQSNHKYPTDFLLGDLLVKAGIVSQKQLDEAIKGAGGKHLNVGQMLIVSRYITARDLQSAVDAQSALRDRVIDLNTAVRGLKTACRNGVAFAEAIKETQDPASTKVIPTNKLGELLLEASIIDGDQFGKALQRSLATGLPLGRILVLNGAISDSLLTTALEIQVRTRDGLLTRQEAIDYLRVAANQIGTDQTSPEKALKIQALLKAPRKSGIRLGELFVLANILAETDVMNALELGLVNDQPIGHILVSQGFISPEVLESALKLQDFVDKDILDTTQAADCLNRMHTTGVSFSESVGDIEIVEEARADVNFQGMLTLARIVSEDDIQNAFEQALMSPELVATVLMMAGYIDEPISEATLRCHAMIASGELTQEDALVALDFCMHKMAERPYTYDEALQELGWLSAPAADSEESALTDAPDSQTGEFAPEMETAAQTAEETMSFAVSEQAQAEEQPEYQQEPEYQPEVDSQEQPYEETGTTTQETLQPVDTNVLHLDSEAMAGVNGDQTESDFEAQGNDQASQQEEAEEAAPVSSEDWNLPELPVPAEDLITAGKQLSQSDQDQSESEEGFAQENVLDVPTSSGTVTMDVAPIVETGSIVTQLTLPPEDAHAQSASSPIAGSVSATVSSSNKPVKKSSLKSLLSSMPDPSGAPTAAPSPTPAPVATASAAPPEGKAVDGRERQSKSGELELTPEEQAIIARASSLSATLADIEAAARIGIRKEQAMRPQVPSQTEAQAESNLQSQSGLEMKKKIDDLEEDKKKDLNLPAVYSFLSELKREANNFGVPKSSGTHSRMAPLASHRALALQAGLASFKRPAMSGSHNHLVGLHSPGGLADDYLQSTACGGLKTLIITDDMNERYRTARYQLLESPKDTSVPPAQEDVMHTGTSWLQSAIESDVSISQLAQMAADHVIGMQGNLDHLANTRSETASGQAISALPASLAPAHPEAKIRLEGLNVSDGLKGLDPGIGSKPNFRATQSGIRAALPKQRPPVSSSAIAQRTIQKRKSELARESGAWAHLGGKANSPHTDEGSGFVLNEAFVRLAETYYQQGKYQASESLYERILALREKECGADSPDIVVDLNNLAGVQCVQGKFEKAQAHVERALKLVETHEPENRLKLADCLNTLAGIHYQQDKFDLCEPLLSKALYLRGEVLGPDHPEVADNLRDYAKLLRKTNRLAEAERMYLKAKTILNSSRKNNEQSGWSD